MDYKELPIATYTQKLEINCQQCGYSSYIFHNQHGKNPLGVTCDCYTDGMDSCNDSIYKTGGWWLQKHSLT